MSADELPGDLRPLHPREPRPEHKPTPILPAHQQEWSSNTRSELRQQLASTSRQFTVDYLWSMPPSTPPDGSAAAEAVPIIPSDLPGTSPRAGTITAYRRPRRTIALGSHSQEPGVHSGHHPIEGSRDVREPNRQEAGHPGTFPDQPERNAARPRQLRQTKPLRVEPKSQTGRKRATRALSPTNKGETPPASAAHETQTTEGSRMSHPGGPWAQEGKRTGIPPKTVAIHASLLWLKRGQPIGTNRDDSLEAERGFRGLGMRGLAGG